MNHVLRLVLSQASLQPKQKCSFHKVENRLARFSLWSYEWRIWLAGFVVDFGPYVRVLFNPVCCRDWPLPQHVVSLEESESCSCLFMDGQFYIQCLFWFHLEDQFYVFSFTFFYWCSFLMKTRLKSTKNYETCSRYSFTLPFLSDVVLTIWKLDKNSQKKCKTCSIYWS